MNEGWFFLANEHFSCHFRSHHPTPELSRMKGKACSCSGRVEPPREGSAADPGWDPGPLFHPIPQDLLLGDGPNRPSGSIKTFQKSHKNHKKHLQLLCRITATPDLPKVIHCSFCEFLKSQVPYFTKNPKLRFNSSFCIKIKFLIINCFQ